MSLARCLNFFHRVIGASRFDVRAYEEVEADHTALGQAIAVVVASSLAAGIGIGGTAAAALAVTVVSLMGWAFWAWVTYVIGVQVFPTKQTDADWGPLVGRRVVRGRESQCRAYYASPSKKKAGKSKKP